ncbi:MAG TPA: PIG-L family deacetylase, partial [Lacibacter sp.]|nr:PIG-L family deacetylase [Lacibacter sp.]
GVELGMIRTQELLAARRIDGAEQFFTTAYDFGFSKSTDEALRIWNKEKILADVVWVIRRFQPDIIITRFPPDSRAGHGHHSASAVLAQEAFLAAADPKRFPEQFKYGVRPWLARRILWNTFSFGSTNTTAENQMKMDVGVFNPLLGKSYGEIASESRSQHKSQGFGVPRQRGQQWEYFTHVNGKEARADIMDDVVADWSRFEGGAAINAQVDELVQQFSFVNPSASVPALIRLYKAIADVKDGYWKEQKREEVKHLIEYCAGLWLEASTNQEYVVNGDSLRVTLTAINRSTLRVEWRRVQLDSCRIRVGDAWDGRNAVNQAALQDSLCQRQPHFVDTLLRMPLQLNVQRLLQQRIVVKNRTLSDPYWLQHPMRAGSFDVRDPLLVGQPENAPVYVVKITLVIEGEELVFTKPVLYKYTDPVKGELYQPLAVYPPVTIKPNQSVLVFSDTSSKRLNFRFTGHTAISRRTNVQLPAPAGWSVRPEGKNFQLDKSTVVDWTVAVRARKQQQATGVYLQPAAASHISGTFSQRIRKISYDHIPTITYFPDAVSKLVYVEVKTAGKKIGYIPGAGDFMPYCLQQLGYEVTLLKQEDITAAQLRSFDAVVTGIRAYNVNDWLGSAYDALMQYVQEGGTLLVQYNTSSQIGPVRAKIGPLPFTISRNRVTEEDAAVTFLAPQHPLFNYPNRITAADFEGWVQERSVYEADQTDPGYVPLLSMHDAGEPNRTGSLVVADY